MDQYGEMDEGALDGEEIEGALEGEGERMEQLIKVGFIKTTNSRNRNTLEKNFKKWEEN